MQVSSGEISFHSTETALPKVQSDILIMSLTTGRYGFELLVLRAAFDTIDHQIFLNVLENDFGVIGYAHIWFASHILIS